MNKIMILILCTIFFITGYGQQVGEQTNLVFTLQEKALATGLELTEKQAQAFIGLQRRWIQQTDSLVALSATAANEKSDKTRNTRNSDIKLLKDTFLTALYGVLTQEQITRYWLLDEARKILIEKDLAERSRKATVTAIR